MRFHQRRHRTRVEAIAVAVAAAAPAPDRCRVQKPRSTATLLALGAVLVAALPSGASAFPLVVPAPAPALSAASPITTALREQVGSAGVYDLSVTVAAGPAAAPSVTVAIGPLQRPAKVDPRTHRASLKLMLAIGRRPFTVRVSPVSASSRVSVSLRRIGSAPAGTTPRVVAEAELPADSGTTRASGTVSKPAAANAPTSSAVSSQTGATGATGSANSPAAPPPAAPPPAAPPAPPAPAFGANGNPIIPTPTGFAPVQEYSNLVKDYEFDGSSLPSDWAAGTWSHGFNATLFQPSQVTMTGSSVALTAINQPSGGYANQSGWISTEGTFSMTHGMVDFRAKMPAGQGLWSGLWLDQPDHSNPWGEIDVQEMLLGDTHTVYGSLHNWAPNPYWGEFQSTVMAADASQGFHDYQVVWQPGYITWAVDGVPYAQYSQWQAAAAGQSWPFDDGTGFYLIADLAVGGPSDWGGAPNSSTVFPATMQLQSVKVWE